MDTKNKKVQVTKNDLFNIHSYAVDITKETPGQSELFKDPQMLMAYCWTMGVYRWLKSKNLTEIELEFK